MNSPVSSLRARMRGMPPHQIDLVLALAVAATTLLEGSLAGGTAGQRAAVSLPALLAAAGMLTRRRDPIAGQVVVTGAVASSGLLAYSVWNSLNAIYLALLFVNYWAASRESDGRFVLSVAVAFAGIVAVSIAFGDRAADDGPLLGQIALGSAFFVAAPATAGWLLQGRMRLHAAIAEKAARVEAERAGRAQEAANAERSRIAGELHDVVAHALGAMTIQAAGARRLAAVKPELAAQAFEAVEITGREALSELRTILDALRDDAESEPVVAPQPTLTALDALAGRARAAGLTVELDVQGTRPEGMPAGIDVTAYRIVQDALNAALHEGGAAAARVRVGYRADRLEVDVVDDGVRASDRRLLGLQERVSVYGGEVEAGAESAGGHAVRAWLPLEGVPA